MRIAFVSNVIHPFVTGGAQKRIHEIGTRLAADGHDVTVYGRQFWDGPQVIDHEGLTLHGVAPAEELYTDDRRSISEAIDFSARAFPSLRRHVDSHDAMVVSVFPFFPVLSAKLASLGTDTPVITTWHEVWLDYWEEYLGRLAPFGMTVERIVANTPTHPIAVSGVTAGRLTEIGPARDHVEVVPNGIDIDQIESTAPAADGFDVLYAGRLIEDKHVDVLLSAFDRVAADRPGLTLGVIGDGPERNRLEQQAAGLDHADRVTMLGFLDEYEDVLAQMRAADVFASPSTREGFGITFVEAMAADCTVVAARHPESAASEVIGNAGFLASATVDEMTSTLARAVDGERPDTAPTAQARRFDWDVVATQAAGCYRRAVDDEW